MSKPALIRLREDFKFPGTASLCASTASDGFSRRSAGVVSAAPQMKGVSENYITEEIVLWTIVDVERRIELEIACDIAGEPDRG
jgi:hypothetical protein